ncbi:MAG TPA: hypothetical protein VFC41_01055 [Anaerovoracaceae bacterium]|nr:hypothetical protein [Anaerovoracaceae bacterium]
MKKSSPEDVLAAVAGAKNNPKSKSIIKQESIEAAKLRAMNNLNKKAADCSSYDKIPVRIAYKLEYQGAQCAERTTFMRKDIVVNKQGVHGFIFDGIDKKYIPLFRGKNTAITIKYQGKGQKSCAKHVCSHVKLFFPEVEPDNGVTTIKPPTVEQVLQQYLFAAKIDNYLIAWHNRMKNTHKDPLSIKKPFQLISPSSPNPMVTNDSLLGNISSTTGATQNNCCHDFVQGSVLDNTDLSQQESKEVNHGDLTEADINLDDLTEAEIIGIDLVNKLDVVETMSNMQAQIQTLITEKQQRDNRIALGQVSFNLDRIAMEYVGLDPDDPKDKNVARTVFQVINKQWSDKLRLQKAKEFKELLDNIPKWEEAYSVGKELRQDDAHLELDEKSAYTTSSLTSTVESVIKITIPAVLAQIEKIQLDEENKTNATAAIVNHVNQSSTQKKKDREQLQTRILGNLQAASKKLISFIADLTKDDRVLIASLLSD